MVICGSGCGSLVLQVFFTITIVSLIGLTSDKGLEGATACGLERILRQEVTGLCRPHSITWPFSSLIVIWKLHVVLKQWAFLFQITVKLIYKKKPHPRAKTYSWGFLQGRPIDWTLKMEHWGQEVGEEVWVFPLYHRCPTDILFFLVCARFLLKSLNLMWCFAGDAFKHVKKINR